ncbi:MAG: membrane protein insertase YidC [Rhodanobacter sp.]
MNQTRTFLLFALMAVAYLLWTAWEKDYGPQPPAAPVATTTSVDGSVPGAMGTTPAAAIDNAQAGGQAATAQLITISSDVLRLTVDTRGGSVVRSELLDYPETPRTKKNPDPAPVRLLDQASTDYFVAQSGLVSSHAEAPDHRAVFKAAQTNYELANGQNKLKVDLTWQDAAGLIVTKSYTLARGSYVVGLSQKIDNSGSTAWQGNAYEQLQRVDRPEHTGWWQNMTDPSAASFFGAAWYSPEDRFKTLKFTEFGKTPLQQTITGGWAAMLQHYFFVAWIPSTKEANSYTTSVINPDTARPTYLIRTIGPALDVAPGQSATSSSQLYIGPKLIGTLDTVAPGLSLATNYGMFTVIATPIHKLLSWLHSISGNWGVAIILLVLIIKGLTWKLTATQYRSSAKMRKLQPRVNALKERYGEDKQKMQQAMMELYKKEKVNPMSGCLPVLITIPIFYGLYEVLRESVELRQAPFFGWIHDLSAPDPFFVLPIIYTAVMLGQQWLMPATAGMDPTQAKMMKFMPLIFAVMFAFFPAGLCLYYVVNGLTSLGQQLYLVHQVEKADSKPKVA